VGGKTIPENVQQTLSGIVLSLKIGCAQLLHVQHWYSTLREKPCQEHEPAVGFEPTTYCLQNNCSAAELRWLKANCLALREVLGNRPRFPLRNFLGYNNFSIYVLLDFKKLSSVPYPS
jgi:hypothetical protein